MSEPKEISNGWAEVESAASRMFKVWYLGGELVWAKEAWGHMFSAGLVGAETILESTEGKLRLITLARIYQEFCGLAWDENPETPVDYLAENLKIDPIALGILAATASTGKDGAVFAGLEDKYELESEALYAATNTEKQRTEIFQCLKCAYGSDVELYRRLWRTNPAILKEDAQGEEFEVTAPNGAALNYVMNGFKEG